MSDEYSHIEEPLLKLVSEGNHLAFTKLFQKYSRLVYCFIFEHTDSKELADDLVQDIFTKIWLIRESLADIRQFRPFLFVLARNHVINDIKKRVRERQRNVEWTATHSILNDEENDQEWNNQLDIIEQAVAQLPEQQRKVWIKSRHDGLKYRDIAIVMNLSKETVKKYVQFANSSIKKYVISRIDGIAFLFLLNFFDKN